METRGTKDMKVELCQNNEEHTQGKRAVSDLWQAYKNSGEKSITALSEIELTLNAGIFENPQAAALVASQIIGDSNAGSDSERMATDIFKRAAACIQHNNPMSLINMFQGCSQRMTSEQAERITTETRLFLGQVSRTAPEKTLN